MSESDGLKKPVVAISYAWTEDNIEWVREKLAVALTQFGGVEVRLDQWDLEPGHNKFVYMERLVAGEDIDKVLVVCDSHYKTKADQVKGGVGTESTIIRPQVYEAAGKNNKFIPIIRELHEGKEIVPCFLEGVIGIRFLDDTNYQESFEQLVRYIFGKPIHKRPQLGKPPRYILEDDAPSALTGLAYSRARAAITEHKPNRLGIWKDFLDSWVSASDGFELTAIPQDFTNCLDDLIVTRINQMGILVQQIAELVALVARYDPQLEYVDDLTPVFEHLLGRSAGTSALADHYRFITREMYLYIVAGFIRCKRDPLAERLLSHVYVFQENGKGIATGYGAFQSYIQSLNDLRNRRLHEGRRSSVTADLLKLRCEEFKILPLEDLQQADLLLCLRIIVGKTNHLYNWYPETLVYKNVRLASAFDLFMRAQNDPAAQRRVALLLDLDSYQEFVQKMDSAEVNSNLAQVRIADWGVDWRGLVGLQKRLRG